MASEMGTLALIYELSPASPKYQPIEAVKSIHAYMSARTSQDAALLMSRSSI